MNHQSTQNREALVRNFLRVLHFIGRLLPPLGKALEGITESLLERPRTTQQILESDGIPSPQASSGQDAEFNKGQNRDARSPSQFSPQQGRGADVRSKGDPTPIAEGAVQASMSSQELALRQIEQDFQDNRKRMNSRIAQIQSLELALFKVLLVCGLVTVVFVFFGAYSLFKNGWNSTGALSEVVALASGAGTAILWRLQRQLQAKSETLDEQQQEQTHYLQTIQATLALTGNEREAQMVETVRALRKRLSPSGAQQSGGGQPATDSQSK